MTNAYHVYILTNKKNGTLYVGVTNNLVRRVHEHREHRVEGFTKKYGLSKLVHYEQTSDIISAIVREKRLKKWQRKWKIFLIENGNPDWRDLYGQIESVS